MLGFHGKGGSVAMWSKGSRDICFNVSPRLSVTSREAGSSRQG